MSKILFSCIGNTDIDKLEKASLFRTIGHIKNLDKVYIYVTSELKDNINDYKEKLKEEFPKVTVNIMLTNDKEPHTYDDAVEHLEEKFNTILEENDKENDKFMFNIASGTPAQKSALIVIAEFQNVNIKLFQASNPRYGRDEVIEIKIKNLSKKIIQKNIIELCDKYEYSGAYDLLEENKQIFDDEMYDNVFKKIKYQKDRHLFIIDNIERSKKKLTNIYESILWLDILSKKEYFHDFIRGLTPTISELLIFLVKEKETEINIYFVPNVETGLLKPEIMKNEIIKRVGIKKDIRTDKKGRAKNIYFYNWEWFLIIKELYKEENDLLSSFEYILGYEDEKRNNIAHSLQRIKNGGNTSEYKVEKVVEFLKKVSNKFVFNKILSRTFDFDWDDYSKKNEEIKSSFS